MYFFTVKSAIRKAIIDTLFDVFWGINHNSKDNLMDPFNLAVCYAPSLFTESEVGHIISFLKILFSYISEIYF